MVTRQRQEQRSISQAYDFSEPIVLAGLVIGGLVGGIAGYAYPKVATTIYGIGFGAGLGALAGILIINRREV